MSKKTILILAIVLILAAWLYTLVSEVHPAGTGTATPPTEQAGETVEH